MPDMDDEILYGESLEILYGEGLWGNVESRNEAGKSVDKKNCIGNARLEGAINEHQLAKDKPNIF